VPKIVDREAQRTKFSEAAMRLIARDGLEGVTMRAVAAEAGLSYGSLFHYFASKDEMLMHVIRHSMAMQTQRANSYSSRHSGLKALEQLLCDDAIINESSRDSWMVWLTFLYKVALQSSFAEMHAELVDGWLERIRNLLEQARKSNEICKDIDIDLESRAIWAYSAGIGQMGLVNPGQLPPEVQKRLISAYLEKLSKPQGVIATD
jgi:AcrR family transcriptional regulator